MRSARLCHPQAAKMGVGPFPSPRQYANPSAQIAQTIHCQCVSITSAAVGDTFRKTAWPRRMQRAHHTNPTAASVIG